MSYIDMQLVAHLVEKKLGLSCSVLDKKLQSKSRDYLSRIGILTIKGQMSGDVLILDLLLLRTAKWVKFPLEIFSSILIELGPFEIPYQQDTDSSHDELWVRKVFELSEERTLLNDLKRDLETCQHVASKLQQEIPSVRVYEKEMVLQGTAAYQYVRPLESDLLDYYQSSPMKEQLKEIIDFLCSAQPVVLSHGGILTHRFILRALAAECLVFKKSIGLLKFPSDADALLDTSELSLVALPEPYSKEDHQLKAFGQLSMVTGVPFIMLRSPDLPPPGKHLGLKYFDRVVELPTRWLLQIAVEFQQRQIGGISPSRRTELIQCMISALDRFGNSGEETITSLVRYNLEKLSTGMCVDAKSNLELLFKLTTQ